MPRKISFCYESRSERLLLLLKEKYVRSDKLKRSSRRWKKKGQMRWKWQRKRMKKEKRKRTKK